MSHEQTDVVAAIRALSDLRELCFKSGVGIHSGNENEVRIFEAASAQETLLNSVFETHVYSAPAHWQRLSGTNRATALILRAPETRRKIALSTIEHLMATLHVFDRHNVIVNVQWKDAAPGDPLEIPILDGSALEWSQALEPSTRSFIDRKVWVVRESFEIKEDTKSVRLEPTSSFVTDYICDVSFHGQISQQSLFTINWEHLEKSQKRFCEAIAPARTFGFKHEIDYLISKGLAKGASLENALVIDQGKPVNPGGFRVENELAAHKLLDAIGDFALIGAPIFGSIHLKEAGHAMHLRALAEAVKKGILVPAFFTAKGLVFDKIK